MDLDECVDELLAEQRVDRWALQPRRQAVGDDVPVEEPHDVERDADDGVVLADRDDRRQADPVRRERELKARLAHHVVGGRRERRTRRPPQDVALVASFEQEGEVRAPTLADALGVDGALTEAVAVEERLEPVEHEERGAVARSLGARRDDVGHGTILEGARTTLVLNHHKRCLSRTAEAGRPGATPQEALAEQRSPTRVARATNRSAPARLPVTKRASNDPLGPRVTRTRLPTCCPFRKSTTRHCTPFRFWSTSNSTSMPPSSSLSFSSDVVALVHDPATSMSPSLARADGASSSAAPIAVAVIAPIVFFTGMLLRRGVVGHRPHCRVAGPGHNETLVVHLTSAR